MYKDPHIYVMPSQMFTIEDMKVAFYAGQETIWEDLEQTTTCPKYDSYEEWIKRGK